MGKTALESKLDLVRITRAAAFGCAGIVIALALFQAELPPMALKGLATLACIGMVAAAVFNGQTLIETIKEASRGKGDMPLVGTFNLVVDGAVSVSLVALAVYTGRSLVLGTPRPKAATSGPARTAPGKAVHSTPVDPVQML